MGWASLKMSGLRENGGPRTREPDTKDNDVQVQHDHTYQAYMILVDREVATVKLSCVSYGVATNNANQSTQGLVS